MPERPPADEAHYTYDLFLSHRSLDKPWVETLARNLSRRGYRVFYDDWVLVPGRPFVDALARGLERSRKAVLVATPEAVESGWVRLEYEAMVARGRRDPGFSFVPLVFGDVHELHMPFLETVHCVDFRDGAADAYRRAFHRLLCGLEDQAPGPDDEVAGSSKSPLPYPSRRTRHRRRRRQPPARPRSSTRASRPWPRIRS